MLGKMGDMMSMMNKLKKAKSQIEKVKKELDNQFIESTSADGNIYTKVSVSGNIESLEIKNYNFPLEDLQDNIKKQLNTILLDARTQYEKKLAENTMEGMPDLQNMFK